MNSMTNYIAERHYMESAFGISFSDGRCPYEIVRSKTPGQRLASYHAYWNEVQERGVSTMIAALRKTF